MSDFKEFCDSFDLIENALNMRNLLRWNGRPIRDKENLSEHTHLVVVCGIQLYDTLPLDLKEGVDFESLIRLLLIHDSLELLRGDILSITKDSIEGLREKITNEENRFFENILGELSPIVLELVELADLKACNEFIRFQLYWPDNEFAKQMYFVTLEKFNKKYNEFVNKHYENTGMGDLTVDTPIEMAKGYSNDAGIDIILNKDVVFLPYQTTTIELDLRFEVNPNELVYLCERSSAAIKGLRVSKCPIDPGYTGNINAIVSNISNNIITYKKGESFCQIIKSNFINTNDVKIKHQDLRFDKKFGSTL